jgi:SAM-dependent methyltransferase
MKPEKIFNLDEISLEIEFTHHPAESHSIFCPSCMIQTKTTPDLNLSSWQFVSNIDVPGEFFCSKCNFSSRHRFYLNFLQHEIENRSIQKIYMPDDYTLATILSKRFNLLSDLKFYISYYETIQSNNIDEVLKYVNSSYQDLTKITYDDDSFDFIMCNHTLEHIFKYDLSIKEMYRTLKPGGHLIITVPIHLDIKENIPIAILGEHGEIQWVGDPSYHGSDSFKHAVFWEFGLEFLHSIKKMCFNSIITIEKYIDHSIGIFNQGQYIIRIVKIKI